MEEFKKQRKSSQWWWFDRLSESNQNQKRSPWLQSTLAARLCLALVRSLALSIRETCAVARIKAACFKNHARPHFLMSDIVSANGRTFKAACFKNHARPHFLMSDIVSANGRTLNSIPRLLQEHLDSFHYTLCRWWHNVDDFNFTIVAELDEKTRAILKLIEEDADSFAQRAEMYYKKRPELVSMVEDFYRTHRLLAERYDQFKSESGTRLMTPWASSTLSVTKCRPEKLMSMNSVDKAYDSYSETYETEDYEESDVEDPEPEEDAQLYNDTEQKEVSSDRETLGNNQVAKLMEEIEELREENRTQKEQLIQKDEEKRDVIRQLSVAMDLLREENLELRKKVLVKNSPKKQNSFELNRMDVFLKRLFDRSPPKIKS